MCVHGVGQRGLVFDALARRLAERGHLVVAVDLRGHGRSTHDPPWTIDTHVADLLDVAQSLGAPATWIGHSFGARLAAVLAVRSPAAVRRLVLMEPALDVTLERVRRSILIERLDWRFSSPDGAVNALLASDAAAGAPQATVAAYAAEDLVRGPDGQYRFSYSASAAIAAWEEIVGDDPPVARLPTLVVRAAESYLDGSRTDGRYRRELGDLLETAAVPGGHNLLWSAPDETAAAVDRFLTSTAHASADIKRS